MKILFINPLGQKINIYIYEQTIPVSVFSIEKTFDIATTLPKTLVDIVEHEDIKEIWCINWPGPFTLMRTISLIINSIKLSKGISIKSWHFFDIIDSHEWKPLLQMNEKEYLVWEKGNILNPSEIPEDIYVGYVWSFWEFHFTWSQSFIEYKEDMKYIYHIFSQKEKESHITPLYFKPPHITSPWLSKKNIFHS
jgi:hypothetical protein